jgi:AraC-like DNA-binding protein
MQNRKGYIHREADAVGLTPANFREQFKRQFGMTPTEYRQNVGK